jgi:hypothetical protein
MNLAPNGKKSNLTNEQYRLVRTNAFKNWFGDWENSPETASKVVDENGEPLVVYHGTDKKAITIFKGTKEIKWEAKYPSNAIFFTSSKYRANYYGKIVKPFFLKGLNQDYYSAKETSGESERFLDKNNFVYENLKGDLIRADGYDLGDLGKYLGKWYTNPRASESNPISISTFVVFNSNQIKLADGTNTTFDVNNNDIRYKNGGNMETEYKVMFESRSGSGNVRDVRVSAKNFNDAKKKGWIKSGLNKKFYAFLTAHEIKAVGGMMAMQILSTGYTLHNNVKPYQYSIGGL